MNRSEKAQHLKDNEGEAGTEVDCIVQQHVDCAASDTGRHVVKAVFTRNGALRHISCECNHEEGEAIRRLGGDSCFILRENLIKQHRGGRVEYQIQSKFPYALGNLPQIGYSVLEARKSRRAQEETEAAKKPRKLRHVLTEKCVQILLATHEVALYLECGVEKIKIGGKPMFVKNTAGVWSVEANINTEALYDSNTFTRSGRSKGGGRYVQTCSLCNKKSNSAHTPTAAHKAAVQSAMSDVVTVLNARVNPRAAQRVMLRVKARNDKFGFKPKVSDSEE